MSQIRKFIEIILPFKDDVKYLIKYSLLVDLVLILCLLFFGDLNTKILLGILVGVIVMVANFVIMVITSTNGLKKSPSTASKYVVISYSLRYIVVFFLLAFCLVSENKNAYAFFIAIHLIYPKIFFSLKILIGKEWNYGWSFHNWP